MSEFGPSADAVPVVPRMFPFTSSKLIPPDDPQHVGAPTPKYPRVGSYAMP